MSRTKHPKILKINGIKDWLSRGFYQKNFPKYLQEDYKIRTFLRQKLKQSLVEEVEIERSPSTLKLIIKTARPALVIGRGGSGVDELRKGLIRVLDIKQDVESKTKRDIKIDIFEIKNPWVSAQLVSQWIASQIEKMVPFRRVLKMSLSKIKEQKEIKGSRVEVAGRLNGVEISRREWLKQDRLPRQTVRSIIDYGFSEAHCAYGTIGVKVWLYKGEKFE